MSDRYEINSDFHFFGYKNPITLKKCEFIEENRMKILILKSKKFIRIHRSINFTLKINSLEI
jgi:hypothetical protein